MFPLGPGPLPTDGAGVAARLAGELARRLRLPAEHVVVDATAAAPERVDRLVVDLSGSSVDVTDLTAPPGGGAPGSLQSEATTVVGALTLLASPAVLLGAPVSARFDAVDVPAAWQREPDGALWLVPSEEAPAGAPMSARAVVEGDVQQVTRAVAAAAAEVGRQRGVTVRDLRITPTMLGRNHVRVDVQATVSKSIMSSKVTAVAEVRVDEALVAHVDTLEASVGGFLRSIAQPVIERQLAPWRGRSEPLAAHTFAGARLGALAIDLDPAGSFRITATS